ncbi:uncharacterized protein LOC143617246 [Bidens hawaiensis]|uniref:uncharacterized protein LOC143617246 n=1 Tax=Bidens hawaiensis TaxID=980011 RepID=UPI00404B0538
MTGNHQSPAAAYGDPQSNQNDVTPAASGTMHRRRNNRKIQTLINAVNFIPFIPKLLILHKHENVLKRLGLYNFSIIKLDQNIRSDLIAQVIANCDPKKRCSSVNGKRVQVSRADLARALELPVGKQDANENDLGVFSDEEIEFLDDFVFNWMLIHEDSWVMPEKIVRMTSCVRDGRPQKLDAASLIWYKVERELGLGVKLVDRYYASHLQRLIRSQCEQLFEMDEERVVKVSSGVEVTLAHETVDELEDAKSNSVEHLLQRCQTTHDAEFTLGHELVDSKNNSGDLNNNEAKVEAVVDQQILEVEDGEGKEDEDDGEHKEKVSTVQEDDARLTLAHDVQLTLAHGNVDQPVDSKNNSGEQLLQLCQTSDLKDNNNEEEVKLEDVVDEQIVEVEDDEVKEDEDNGEHIQRVSIVREDDAQLTLSHNVELTFGHETVDELMDSKNNSGEQFLQHSQTGDLNNEEVKVDDVVDEQIVKVDDENDDGEKFVEGLDMEANDDVVGSRDDSFLSHGGPSFFGNNNGKRVMESEDDTHYLDMNNKRLKTNDILDHNQSEFGLCMVQMNQWIEKAKMITDSKQQSYANRKYHLDSAMHELQDRQQVTEMIIKSKDEALEKKHAEVYRLKHELYLMGDLLSGYRKALNDERVKFSEYRERARAQEKLALKDVGSGDVSQEKGGSEEH